MIIIDRFEGELAVCDADGDELSIARSVLPEDASEGDVITPVDGGRYLVDEEATHKRRAALKSRLFSLTHKSGITEK